MEDAYHNQCWTDLLLANELIVNENLDIVPTLSRHPGAGHSCALEVHFEPFQAASHANIFQAPLNTGPVSQSIQTEDVMQSEVVQGGNQPDLALVDINQNRPFIGAQQQPQPSVGSSVVDIASQSIQTEAVMRPEFDYGGSHPDLASVDINLIHPFVGAQHEPHQLLVQVL